MVITILVQAAKIHIIFYIRLTIPFFQCPGILPGGEGTTLTIKGNGSLFAQSSVDTNYPDSPRGASIGCGVFNSSSFPAYKNTSCGNIRIEGGTITATGGSHAAGIGTGYDGSCGNITISGGTITATGGSYAAGIGTGFGTTKASESNGSGATCTCGNIIISGGTITATGGGDGTATENAAAGIGAGFNGYCPSINIGGTSTGTAIGVGDYSNWCIGGRNNNGCCCPSITIFDQPVSDIQDGKFHSPYSWPSSKH